MGASNDYDEELDGFDAVSNALDAVRGESEIHRTIDEILDKVIPIAEAALPVGISIAEAMQPAGPIGTMVIGALGKLGEDGLRRWAEKRKIAAGGG